MLELENSLKSVNSELIKNKSNGQVGYLMLKRIIDIVISIIGLILTSPILLLTAIAIKLETPGPIIFKQVRLGKNGKRFTIYKFRSMIQNAERDTGAIWAKKNDNRVTNVGKFIRKTRIDELPQFINILRGEISLIGPRPERPELTEKFEKQYPGFKNRLLIKPGVTGLAQIKGGYDITPGQKYRLDKLYIKKRNLLLDLEIMFKTGLVMVLGDGAR